MDHRSLIGFGHCDFHRRRFIGIKDTIVTVIVGLVLFPFVSLILYLTKSKKSILEGLGIIFIQGVIDGLTHITINDVISRVINSFGNNEIDSLIESRKGIRSLLNKSGNL